MVNKENNVGDIVIYQSDDGNTKIDVKIDQKQKQK